ncbi:integrase arm-type DNA-binding domain-containing protein [Candidatus Accumulibacter sp. ACC005]|jgi:Integrase|uniref:tyrosine-type recombinase/integrase n=1 Tax=Candidatus Accumulibacter sp. ACC005 TaxID=2823331 RepID=UPI0025C497F9|nr:integrase arm-type DNA-binding domain-containing protein [Candidatus Accumulibacter sp. ACC005]
MMALSDAAVRSAKSTERPTKLFDGRGLFLFVTPAGGKLWRFKYCYAGKEKLLSLGRYPDITLKEARALSDDARKLLAHGIDPGDRRKAGASTFEAVARRWFAKQQAALVPAFARKVIRSLEADVFPTLGNRPINDIKPPEVLMVLRKVEARGALETLKRIRQRVADVFTFAIAEGLREDVNPVTGLEKALKTAKAEHRPSLHSRELPEFFIRLDAARISKPVKLAVRLSLLTFLRPGELRCARWEEIDLERATWIVPGERDRARGLVGMKMKEDHLVPLSRRAVEVFEELHAYSGDGDLVFPNRNDPRRPISDGTVNSALRAMGYSTAEACGHGFRATAASALAELGFRREVIDSQLSHRERSAVLGAYVHMAEYAEERRRMMQHWADYVDNLEHGRNVVPLKKTVAHRRAVDAA